MSQPAAVACVLLLCISSNGIGQKFPLMRQEMGARADDSPFRQDPRLDHAYLGYKCDDVNRAPCSVCGRESPRCDYTLFANKLKGPWMPCCEKRQFIEMLGWFNDVVQPHIDNNGKGFWYSLAMGSLLGSVRGGDMIDWDTDVDIAVPEDRLSWLETLLRGKVGEVDPAYHVASETAHGVTVLRLYMSKTNTAHIDIWSAEGFTAGEPCQRIGPHISPNYGGFPLQKCAMGNLQVPCLDQRDKYLKSWYGSAWNSKGTNKNNGAPDPLPAGCKLSSSFNLKLGTSASLQSEIPDFD